MKKLMFAAVCLSATGLVFAQEAVSADETVAEKCTVEEKGVQDMMDAFMNAKGWTLGPNTKNGKTFFVATGTGVIQAPRSKPGSYVNSRVNAFNKAMLEAKKNMVEYLGTEIESRTERSYQEGKFPTPLESLQSTVGDIVTELGLDKDLMKATTRNAANWLLSANGVPPDVADPALANLLNDTPSDPELAKKIAARKAAEEKILATETYKKFVRTMAQAQVVGLQAVCTFEGTPSNDKGEIGVVAIWSPKLQAMAASIATGRPVPKATAKRPIAEQIAKDPGALLATFGVQQKIDEQGDLVLVGFGQAGGVSESKMAAKGAQAKAKMRALAAIREFAGESVAVSSEMRNMETTKDLEDSVSEFTDESAYREKVTAAAKKMDISGISVIKNWKFKHPLTGTMVYGVVCTWAPKQAGLAQAIRQTMANPTATVPSVAPATPKPAPTPAASSFGAAGQSGDDDAF